MLIKSDCNIYVNISGLHMNAKQWQRPKEFLPQRFDPNDPLYLTPDGKKRHTMSLAPFNGGKRICFGKTFAESSARLASTYISQYFDFEFVEKDKYPDTNNLPMNYAGQSHFPHLLVKFTVRAWFKRM